MARQKITAEHRSEIVKRYSKGESCPALAKAYGVRPQTIERILENTGIPRRQRLYSVNEHYFDEIKSEAQSYWLGYLFAEGSLDTKRYTTSIKIGAFDREH